MCTLALQFRSREGSRPTVWNGLERSALRQQTAPPTRLPFLFLTSVLWPGKATSSFIAGLAHFGRHFIPASGDSAHSQHPHLLRAHYWTEKKPTGLHADTDDTKVEGAQLFRFSDRAGPRECDPPVVNSRAKTRQPDQTGSTLSGHIHS